MEKEKNLNPNNKREEGMDRGVQKLIEEINQNPNFVFINKLGDELPTAEIFLVGGAVRDALLGRKVKDFDFLVTGVEKEKLESFLNKFGQVEDVESRAFGVFKFRPKGWRGEEIDISLPRKEKQTGLGYKDFRIETSPKLKVEDDLARRDFTINAIAVKLQIPKFKKQDKKIELIDSFGGQKDLEKGIIRTVGNPCERFQEDPSRILRACRLACQLNFEIETQTKKAAKELVEEINKTFVDEAGKEKTRVASEVIAAEFLKGFYASPLYLIELYEELGILKILLPELLALKGVQQPENFHAEGDVWDHTILVLKNLKPSANINVKLAALFHDIGKPLTQTMPRDKNDRIRFNEHDEEGAKIFAKICNRLKLVSPFPKDDPLYVDKREIVWLIRNHMICVGKNPKEMRPGTIEKYFFKNPSWGKDLLELSSVDIASTIIASTGRPDFSSFKILKKRIKEVEEILKKQKKEKLLMKKFPYLLDGYGVMAEFNIPSGPLVGRIKDLIRYLQLEGKVKTLKDVKEIKKEIMEACQRSQTTEEAEEYLKANLNENL